MRTGEIAGGAAALLLTSWPAAAIAQNNVVADVTAPATPAEEPAPDPEPIPVQRNRPAPAPNADEPIVTTVPVPAPSTTVEPLPDMPENPYANSYNELLPIEEEPDDGFDWGLLGLLGLIGLFGLARRGERVVYVERADREIVQPRTGEPLP